jgi:hypothetical protein
MEPKVYCRVHSSEQERAIGLVPNRMSPVYTNFILIYCNFIASSTQHVLSALSRSGFQKTSRVLGKELNIADPISGTPYWVVTVVDPCFLFLICRFFRCWSSVWNFGFRV